MNDESKFHEKAMASKGYTLVPGKGFRNGDKLLIKPCPQSGWSWLASDTHIEYNTLREFVTDSFRRWIMNPGEETQEWLKQLQKNF